MRGSPLTTLDRLEQAGIESVAASDDVDPYGLLEAPMCLSQQIPPQEREQRAHLGGGPIPVVGRERIQSQCADAVSTRRRNHRIDRFRARAMSGAARQMAARRPTPVTVHDHCYVHFRALCYAELI